MEGLGEKGAHSLGPLILGLMLSWTFLILLSDSQLVTKYLSIDFVRN